MFHRRNNPPLTLCTPSDGSNYKDWHHWTLARIAIISNALHTWLTGLTSLQINFTTLLYVCIFPTQIFTTGAKISTLHHACTLQHCESWHCKSHEIARVHRWCRYAGRYVNKHAWHTVYIHILPANSICYTWLQNMVRDVAQRQSTCLVCTGF